MSLGKRLLDLRKSKQLSQEEVADKLNVTRQTVSKWETDQSTPDFDKVIPLCELYGVSSNQLLTGNDESNGEDYKNSDIKEDTNISKSDLEKKRAIGISISVFLYIVSVAWLLLSISTFYMNPIASTAVFLFICAVATCIIVYTNIMYKKEEVKEKEESSLIKQIIEVLSIVTLLIYLVVSFITMAWNITWIIWIVYALCTEILKLIFGLKEEKDDE